MRKKLHRLFQRLTGCRIVPVATLDELNRELEVTRRKYEVAEQMHQKAANKLAQLEVTRLREWRNRDANRKHRRSRKSKA